MTQSMIKASIKSLEASIEYFTPKAKERPLQCGSIVKVNSDILRKLKNKLK